MCTRLGMKINELWDVGWCTPGGDEGTGECRFDYQNKE